MKSTRLKMDLHRVARGGHARMWLISCRECDKQICCYQKDGPGSLRRMYIDRIIESIVSVRGNNLTCPEGHILGVKIIYKKEKQNRLAFRLFVDAVTKKMVKAQ